MDRIFRLGVGAGGGRPLPRNALRSPLGLLSVCLLDNVPKIILHRGGSPPPSELCVHPWVCLLSVCLHDDVHKIILQNYSTTA